MRSSGTPRHERHGVGEAQPLDRLGAAATLLRPADDHEGDVALGAQLGDRLEQVAEALQRDVGAGGGDEPAGHPLDVGQRLEQLGVDADRDEAHVLARHPEVGVDVVDRVLGDDDDPRQVASDPGLHLREAVPAP